MSDKAQAIQVSTDIEIDWAQLGRVFADEPSSHQAAFIMGFYEGVIDMQLAYIGAEPIFVDDREDVANLITALADFIRNPA